MLFDGYLIILVLFEFKSDPKKSEEVAKRQQLPKYNEGLTL